MRRLLSGLILGLALASVSLQAAGTVTKTAAVAAGSGSLTRYTFTWLSNGSGDVSGDTTTIILSDGDVVRLELVPNSAGTQPSDQYDVTLLDARGVDVLGGLGANLSNASAVMVTDTGLVVDRGEALQLVVANAGSAKGGTLILWVR
jgi:hypothetical protein